jgi:AP2 domain/HNH endonuclease
MPEIPLTKGFIALVDEEDFDLVSQMRWYAHADRRNNVYARSRTHNQTGIYMHRLILGAAKGDEVDHHNHNGLDNRRSNLRLCSRTQNNGNARLQRHNTSGFKGVSFNKPRNRWQAYINFEGKKISLGYFDSPRHAALKYNAAASEYFGEFANVNRFPIRMGKTNV